MVDLSVCPRTTLIQYYLQDGAILTSPVDGPLSDEPDFNQTLRLLCCLWSLILDPKKCCWWEQKLLRCYQKAFSDHNGFRLIAGRLLVVLVARDSKIHLLSHGKTSWAVYSKGLPSSFLRLHSVLHLKNQVGGFPSPWDIGPNEALVEWN